MNRQIAKLTIVFMTIFLILFSQLNLTQLIRANEYKSDPSNTRSISMTFTEPRGLMRTVDGEIIAETISNPGDLKRLRQYPFGNLYAHITGFISFEYGASGLERHYNSHLSGTEIEVRVQNASDLFLNRNRTANLELTLRHDVQLVARAALGDHSGAVVAINPKDGAILALWSNPSYDPNNFSSHDLNQVDNFRDDLLSDPQNPIRSKAYQESYPPGPIFSVITASAGLSSNIIAKDRPIYPQVGYYVAPQTKSPITNVGGKTCGGVISEMLEESCNTGFAQMAISLGPTILVKQAEAFGFNSELAIGLPEITESFIHQPEFYKPNLSLLAQSGIGEGGVSATPLQMASVASAIANGGIFFSPRIINKITTNDGEVLKNYQPQILGRPITKSVSEELKAVLLDSVERGTAQSVQTAGVKVGAKIGIVRVKNSTATHNWVIAFAPVTNPEVAVAVFVEEGGSEGVYTQGTDAGPIARAVIEASLRLPTSTVNEP